MPVLSVLDQSPIRQGGTAAQALQETIELAQAADRLGYHRYWLAEHHNSAGLASASPEILIAEVANRTRHIRVGSGGVMLTHYSALKVAEQFRMLETLHPGRIDLGVGRAPGSDTRTMHALVHGPGKLPIEAYPEQLMDLYGWVAQDLPPGHPFTGVRAMPEGGTVPELWVLGSSAVSAIYAAELGWSFCFAHFIQQDGGERAMAQYRQNFEPSPFLPAPRGSIGVSATVAETDEEAEYLSWSRWGWRLMNQRGLNQRGIPSPEDAMAFDYTAPERDYLEFARSRSIYGTPARVADRLAQLGEAHGVEEFVVVTITHSHSARIRSYELLASAFGIEPRD
jgi:luciferase family oxidoreductase group 1